MSAEKAQTDPTRSSPAPRGRPPIEISSELREEIVRLHRFYGTRQIARRVKLSRKLVRRFLAEQGCLSAPRPGGSKLEPFQAVIESKVAQGLTVSRILREIRQIGYSGGRSILAEQVRTLRATMAPATRKKAKRRFETRPGMEMQIDWSPYEVSIGGVKRVVYAFGCLLAASRKVWVHFYRNERQSTLLEALASAFEYFRGSAWRVVLDYVPRNIIQLMCPFALCDRMRLDEVACRR